MSVSNLAESYNFISIQSSGQDTVDIARNRPFVETTKRNQNSPLFPQRFPLEIPLNLRWKIFIVRHEFVRYRQVTRHFVEMSFNFDNTYDIEL